MYRFSEEIEADSFDTETLFSSVLLIEDETAHAKLLERALKGVVGEVSRAATGAEAIQLLQTSFSELVFCDLNLPDTSGLELIRAIHEYRPGLPVIVMTSSSRLDDAVSAMREGAWEYMLKQFDDELSNRIRLVVQQIAKRKLLEMREIQLRGERDAFWAAAYSARDGMAILSSEGLIVFENEAFKNFRKPLGGAEGEQNALNLLGARDERLANELREQLAGDARESIWSSELKFESPEKDVQPRYYELSLSSAKLGNFDDITIGSTAMTSFRHYVLWVQDISRRKEQEKFQRDLLSTTSHDLKGPLGAVLTSAELLSEGVVKDPKAVAEMITRIASCARNCISIIDELLSARRIQDGVLVVRPQWCEVNEFLQDIVLDYLPMAKAKNIEFFAKQIDPEVKIYADKVGLNRVIGNLISNALKFTPRDGAVILNAERRGNATLISVTDTGQGIEAKARHLLFQRYSRLEKHSDIEGTGLGLFVTKNIVEAHNGRIDLRSEVGVGTTFIVTFPDEIKS